jgi:hypothetical protein
LRAPQEAHAEKVGGERALLGDRGRYIAHGDVLDAHAVERHWRHARDAVRRLGDAGELEATRGEAAPLGVLIGEDHEGSRRYQP